MGWQFANKWAVILFILSRQYQGCSSTGNSFSEPLILASVNPQYDKRLLTEFPKNYTTCCVQKLFLLFWHSKQCLYTTWCELVFWGEFNEQSLVILWINWFNNESIWKRITCNENHDTIPAIKLSMWIFSNLPNFIPCYPFQTFGSWLNCQKLSFLNLAPASINSAPWNMIWSPNIQL